MVFILAALALLLPMASFMFCENRVFGFHRLVLAVSSAVPFIVLMKVAGLEALTEAQLLGFALMLCMSMFTFIANIVKSFIRS